mgnify:CR=1 FL=1
MKTYPSDPRNSRLHIEIFIHLQRQGSKHDQSSETAHTHTCVSNHTHARIRYLERNELVVGVVVLVVIVIDLKRCNSRSHGLRY